MFNVFSGSYSNIVSFCYFLSMMYMKKFKIRFLKNCFQLTKYRRRSSRYYICVYVTSSTTDDACYSKNS